MPITDQHETARQLGYGDDVEAMNRDHDQTHGWITMSLGIPSYSLALSRGETLTQKQCELAWAEEAAVLAIQKLRQLARNS